MATDGRSYAIIDASTLVNFLRTDRADLLGRHPAYRFVVVDRVRSEVTKRHSAQTTRLEAAFTEGHLRRDQPPESTSMVELEAYAAMATARIGDGERAAIAAAKARQLPLAMDDVRAWKRAGDGLERLDTLSVMMDLIRAGAISVVEADAFKAEWEGVHRPLKTCFVSFTELLG